MRSHRQFAAVAAFVTFAVAAVGANAETWPSQPLRIIVPNVPGGSSDIISRLITKPLSDAFGVPVIVENRPGANGNIGAAAVAQATDGHTILLCDLPSLAISPSIYKNMPCELGKDLQGVAMLAYSPHLLVVNPSVQASTLPEFIALSKKSGIKRYASTRSAPQPRPRESSLRGSPRCPSSPRFFPLQA